VPQLRNLYEKTRFDNEASMSVRGFGYTHDGASDDLFSFLQFPGFAFADDDQRRDVAAFLLCFDTGTHAAVGAQWTMDGSNETAGLSRINTLVGLANDAKVGLIAKGRDLLGVARGWTYQGGGAWLSDRQSEGSRTLGDLLNLADSGHEVTFTALVTGTETRLGIDRDGDGFRDRDEIDAGADPGDPLSIPTSTAISGADLRRELRFALAGANPTVFHAEVEYSLPETGGLRVTAHDVQGRQLRVLHEDNQAPAGPGRVRWDLRDSRGVRVAAGVYFVRLTQGVHTRALRLVVQ